ncbi:hypothetical protein PR001_g32768 [Phytophthora rubi]|uniref:Uncharacterized protein n=1 Tax=Phytophthora rubi TaxID=129364 RepID=A0A6A3G9T3_9STRA|nr:hypothetical protein PR001_g32768 [Phytophthora rubi]
MPDDVLHAVLLAEPDGGGAGARAAGPELSFTHSPNMNASEEDKNSKALHVTRASDSDGNPWC